MAAPHYELHQSDCDSTVLIGNSFTYTLHNTQNVNIHSCTSASETNRVRSQASTELRLEIKRRTRYYVSRDDERVVARLVGAVGRGEGGGGGGECEEGGEGKGGEGGKGEEGKGGEGKGPKTFIVHGAKGTGKTSFAREFARRCLHGHLDGPFAHAWWIGANNVSVFEADLAAMMESSSWSDTPVDRSAGSSRDSVHRFLGSLLGAWLLVLDDACQDVLEVLHEMVPGTGRGLVLVNTTVRPAGFVSRELDYEEEEWRCMEPGEAVRLLKSTAGDVDSEDGAYAEIARCVQYLPFSLDLAGTFLRHKNQGESRITPAMYVEQLTKQRSAVLDYARGPEDSAYSVISATMVQVQREYTRAGGGQIVQDVLRLLSFMLPENVPLHIMPFRNDPYGSGRFRTVRQSEWIKERVEALVGIYRCSEISKFDWMVLEQHLDTYHILHRTRGEMGTTYSMHSLFLLWAEHTMREDRKTYLQWRTTAAVMIASARIFSGLDAPAERLVLLSKLHPHWEVCQHSGPGGSRHNKDAFMPFVDLELDTNAGSDPDGERQRTQAMQDVLFEQIEIYKARGYWRDVLQYSDHLLMLRIRGDASSESIMDSRSQLACCYECLGQHEDALRYRKLVFKHTDTDPSSDEHFDATMAYTKSLTKLRCFPEVEIILKASRDELTKTYSEDDDRVVRVEKRLGVLYDRTGRTNEAVRYRETVLAKLSARGYPEHHPEILDAQVDLAYSYSCGSERQKKMAIGIHRKVVQAETQHLPRDHPRVLLARENLAWRLVMKPSEANIEEAHAILLEALHDRMTRLGDRHRLTLKARIRLAACELRMDDMDAFARASKRLKQCLVSDSKHLDDDTRHWAMQELAFAASEAESPSHALLCYGLLLRIKLHQANEEKFKAGSPELVTSARMLAETLESLGFWQTALAFRRVVASSLRAGRDAFDDDVLRAQCRLATNLSESPHEAQQEEAIRLFVETWETVNRRVESNLFAETDLCFYTFEYVEVLRRNGDFTNAVALLGRLLSFCKTVNYVSKDDVEYAELLLDECEQRVGIEPDAYHESLAGQLGVSPFVDVLPAEYPGVSLEEGWRIIEGILSWERDARSRYLASRPCMSFRGKRVRLEEWVWMFFSWWRVIAAAFHWPVQIFWMFVSSFLGP